MKDLIVKHDDNGVFNDISKSCQDFLRDSETIEYTLSEDYIYIGLYKPFNAFYAELISVTGNASYEYYNGSWEVLSVNDDTRSLSRSGFVEFEKPADWSSTTVDNDNLYWLRLSLDATVSLELKGLNIVFSDDQDLSKEVRDINDFIARGDSSFIAYHVSSRDQIIQTIRNGGDYKNRVDNALSENITKWDILDLGEIRQASKFLTLSKIFFDVSENVDDKAYLRYVDFSKKYGESFKLFRMSLDKDDDGIKDSVENLALNEIIVSKR